MIVTEVIDNGPGSPFRFRQKIFRRFVRLGSELQREKPGTGLGLYIVYTLVRRLRGKVRVLDRSSGPGTVFEISLPGRPTEALQETSGQAK
jgi:signal transduction histidine kinase